MRPLFALALISTAVAGCSPQIPVKADFGTSALAPAAGVPAQYAAFNNYDPSVAELVARQICATPYIRMQRKDVGATPGRMAEDTGRCASHMPLTGSGGLVPYFDDDQ